MAARDQLEGNDHPEVSPSFSPSCTAGVEQSSHSHRGGTGAQRQATELEAEGVEVTRGNLGEYEVDFKRYGWFPDSLESNA